MPYPPASLRSSESVLTMLGGGHSVVKSPTTLSALHESPVHAHPCGELDAEIRGVARLVRGRGAGNKRLGRDTSGVHARATEIPALDDRDFPSCLGQAPGQGRKEGAACPVPMMIASKAAAT